MTTITALPTPPSRSDPTNFNARSDAFLGALPTFVTETNTVASEVNTNATNAATAASNAAASKLLADNSANAAASSAATAASVAGATKWISGTAYTQGQCTWSPITFLTYRCKVNTSGTTDPSADNTNWMLLSAPTILPIIYVSTNTTAVSGNHYILTASCVLTFPASAAERDTIMITDISATGTCTVNPNGLKFKGDSSVMQLTGMFMQKQFYYTNSTNGWI